MRNLFKIFVIVAATAGLAQGAVIFQDTFENNVVTNSDSVNGFWKVTATGAGSSITETNGVLDMQTTSDVSGNSELLQLGSVSAQSDFDFFSKQLTFSADVVSQGGTVGDVQSELRFALHTGSGYEFQADDYFHILIQKGNNVFVQERINGSAATISNINYNTHVSRFDLTLDNSGWSLDLTDTNSVVSTYSGSHNLTASDWDTTGSYVAFLAAKQVDNFQVIPEPGTLGTLAAAFFALLLRRRLRKD